MNVAEERRHLERFSLEVPAFVITRGRLSTRQRIQAQTRDISANGAFIFLDHAPAVGTRLRLEMEFVIDSLPELINVPEQVHIRVDGKVIRQNTRGVGVIFDAQLKIEQRTGSGEADDVTRENESGGCQQEPSASLAAVLRRPRKKPER